MKNKGFQFYALGIIAFLFPFFTGGYYSFYCAGVNILMVVLLIVNIFKNKKANISISFPAIAITVFLILNLIVKLWAVDKSMSVYGFIKFLTPFLYMLNLLQVKQEDRKDILYFIPYSAVTMTISSYCLGQVKAMHYVFFDNMEDLHGMFEYANAFAAFLLIGTVILILKPFKKVWQKIIDVILIIPLIWGIYLSGSRSIYLISVGVIGLIVFFSILSKMTTKKIKIAFVAICALLGVMAVIVAYMLGIVDKGINYLSSSGSFNQRLLYDYDGFRYALKHPFGKGAYAFYYAQTQFQSGNYYAIDVHNDYLQMMIEIGIIPAIAFIAMIISALVSKKNTFIQKMVLLVIAVHSFVDYDLQFVSLWIVLVLCLSFYNEKEIEIKGVFLPVVLAALVVIPNIILGLSSIYNNIGNHKQSLYYYKNTPSYTMLLASTNDQQTGYYIANEILKRNEFVYEANDTLSAIYQANSRYDEAIEQKEIVLEKTPRNMNEYKGYIDLLQEAIQKTDDEKKKNEYREKIVNVENMLEEVDKNTSSLAYKTGKKQNINVGKKYQKIINQYK